MPRRLAESGSARAAVLVATGMSRALTYVPFLALLLIGGCTTLPSGPSMLVLPGTGKSFDEFRYDDGVCRQYAHAQVGGKTPGRTLTRA